MYFIMQAYFAVIDGHGGTAAANFVAENLGKNIVKALGEHSTGKEEHVLEHAIRKGYYVTDTEFLNQVINDSLISAPGFTPGQIPTKRFS